MRVDLSAQLLAEKPQERSEDQVIHPHLLLWVTEQVEKDEPRGQLLTRTYSHVPFFGQCSQLV